MMVFLCGYLFLKRDVLPASWSSFGLFLVSFLLAFLIQYFICFIFVQGAFYTYSGYGIFAARGAMHQTFSGVSAPLLLYPSYLKTTAEWLPFRHTVQTPISIYMGWVQGSEAVGLVLQQVLWAVGLLVLGKLLMIKALKQLEVQGG
jgi:ABC-2 type transport system permease protein